MKVLLLICMTALALSSCTGPRYADVYRSGQYARPSAQLNQYCEAAGRQAYSAAYNNAQSKAKNEASANALDISGLIASIQTGGVYEAAVRSCMGANGFSPRRECVRNCDAR